MADEYWQGQVILIDAELENPASTTGSVGTHGETLTDDASETLIAVRQDGTHGTVAAAAHPSTGHYTAQVTADQPGYWQVNDGRGGVYEFYVKPVRS